jgi:hypothetical protein
MHDIYHAVKIGLKVEPATDAERLQRFRRHLLELKEYLRHNWNNLTNYAHAHRHGLRISSAPAESGMSHLVNQRMGKRQPMRWSAAGAHQLLQVRLFHARKNEGPRHRCKTPSPGFLRHESCVLALLGVPVMRS